jgi:hypothetical protein
MITYDKILSFDPCHSPEKCLEMMKGVKEYSLMDFLDLDSVTAEDKLWVVLREDFIDDAILHEFACRCVEAVLPLFEKEFPDDKRPRNAIAAKRKWLKGEITDKELTAASDAAWSAWATREAAAARAAASAAWGAAWGAAWDAARAAAWGAARAAAWDAAWGAAWDAARAAAWGAARAYGGAQLEILKDLICQ